MKHSMKHRQRIPLANQPRVEVQIEVEAALCFHAVNSPRHEKVGRVVVALRLDEARVKLREFRIPGAEFAGKDLKLFAAPPFDQRAADQVVDDLLPLAIRSEEHTSELQSPCNLVC